MFGNRYWGYLLCRCWLRHLRRGSSPWRRLLRHMGALPRAGTVLSVGRLSGCETGGHAVTVLDSSFPVGPRWIACRRKVIPKIRLGSILRYTVTVLVHEPEGV